jgi:hypothetical protein
MILISSLLLKKFTTNFPSFCGFKTTEYFKSPFVCINFILSSLAGTEILFFITFPNFRISLAFISPTQPVP